MFETIYYNRILPEYYRLKYKSVFNKVPVYAMFIGYPRSGHSLVGAIIDAHPNVVMGHEVNVLRLLERGFKPDFIMGRIMSKAVQFVKNEGSRTGYKYLIPNQYNGNFTELKVIGDKKGGTTVRLITENFELIHKVDLFGKKVKMIHVIRNPYDNIASRARGGNLVRREVTPVILDKTITKHFERVDVIEKLKGLGKYEIFDLHGEDLLKDPPKHIRELFAFLDLEVSDSFIRDCESIMFKKPKQTRRELEWTEDQIKKVRSFCLEVDFLKNYSFDQ